VRRYRVTLTVLVDAKTSTDALDRLQPAADKALKVGLDGVDMTAEEVPDE
jgi:hypothetical protein